MAQHILKKMDEFQPDIVHVHNTFPLISPAVFHAISHKAACVLTLHNYRLFCSAGIFMHNGKICTECLDQHSVWPALKYGCCRNSRIATAPLAINIALHRKLGTWDRKVDVFIALSNFQKNLMIKAGLPANKVAVKPNFYPGNPVSPSWESRESYVVFVGRLDQEKGLETLVKAWALWGKSAPELRLVGEGPLRHKLEHLENDSPIRFLGLLSPAKVQEQIEKAKLLILPSEWYETFGLVLLEAFSLGTPVAVSNIGSLPSIVQDGRNGIVFEPANPESLMNIVRNTWETSGLLENMGRNGRKTYETLYTEETNYQILMEIYEKAISENKRSHSIN
jgi:glycosyltransferase involved in cell wall biosynthesis